MSTRLPRSYNSPLLPCHPCVRACIYACLCICMRAIMHACTCVPMHGTSVGHFRICRWRLGSGWGHGGLAIPNGLPNRPQPLDADQIPRLVRALPKDRTLDGLTPFDYDYHTLQTPRPIFWRGVSLPWRRVRRSSVLAMPYSARPIQNVLGISQYEYISAMSTDT